MTNQKIKNKIISMNDKVKDKIIGNSSVLLKYMLETLINLEERINDLENNQEVIK